MKYVYILQSEKDVNRHYIGTTFHPDQRSTQHNAGESVHTNKFRPWRVETLIAFSDGEKADRFEQYLKSGSGRAFAKKHF